ncbi:5-formyltetrahydrofolate cyclo-ligase [Chondromyces crocatus]|uniref:5-formyltetrahydrofolate cyclo-ligase n=1 Tax=Chondromyces crocatus TaxID=52 RepID=A0A0K1E773_CHOCO|nr:5-formyltetrahydrofolate cyclo-ligase [Chondromyces crocatus]AKT36699.1 5-formyltetrahydrofolate cyclo-ligase [Chondromyces crocatus]
MDIDENLEVELRFRAKAAMRKRARGVRGAVPRDAILKRSAQIQDTLSSLPEIAAASRIALFFPIEGRNEVDLVALDARLRERGARIAYPTVDRDTRTMTFRFVDDPHAMEEQGSGFCEPGPSNEEALALDVIVVPCLQIDPRGYRIGYGAGYYDRTLPRFCPPARAIAVAFDFQLVSEIPDTASDVPVHVVVTDTRVLRIDAPAAETPPAP